MGNKRMVHKLTLSYEVLPRMGTGFVVPWTDWDIQLRSSHFLHSHRCIALMMIHSRLCIYSIGHFLSFPEKKLIEVHILTTFMSYPTFADRIVAINTAFVAIQLAWTSLKGVYSKVSESLISLAVKTFGDFSNAFTQAVYIISRTIENALQLIGFALVDTHQIQVRHTKTECIQHGTSYGWWNRWNLRAFPKGISMMKIAPG